eukprot:7195058-Lingulodinium_polyedra.AAC.1
MPAFVRSLSGTWARLPPGSWSAVCSGVPTSRSTRFSVVSLPSLAGAAELRRAGVSLTGVLGPGPAW